MLTITQLVNPPADVTTALAALQQACADWRPAQVSVHQQAGAGSIALPFQPYKLQATEEQACLFIRSPSAFTQQDIAAAAMMIGGPMLLVAVILLLSRTKARLGVHHAKGAR